MQFYFRRVYAMTFKKYLTGPTVLALFFMISMFLVGWIYNKSVFFPLDDSYIYVKQSSNLAQGYFLKYSKWDEYTNSNSSLLYYLLMSLVWKVSTLFSDKTDVILEFVVWITFLLNLPLFIFFGVRARQILEESPLVENEKKNYLWLILTCAPIWYNFLNGLETGLTITLVACQFYAFIKRRHSEFLILTLLLSINRPENIILNLSYIGIYLFQNFRTPELKVALRNSTLILISLGTIPITDFLLTGIFKTASSARVGSIGLAHFAYFGKSLFRALSTFYFSPDFLMPWLEKCYRALYIVVGWSMTLPLLYKIFLSEKTKVVKHEKWSLDFSRLLPDIKTKKFFYLAIMILAVGYGGIPTLLGTYGEWARYVAPILFFIGIILLLVIRPPQLVLAVLFVLNVLMYPPYLISHLNVTSLIRTLHHPVALKVEEVVKEGETLSIDSAGYMSLFHKGNVIDVYGLGTTRYMKVHGNFPKVYDLIRGDNISYIVAWPTEKSLYYLDSAHYRAALGEDALEEIYTAELETFTTIQSDFPKRITLYKVRK